MPAKLLLSDLWFATDHKIRNHTARFSAPHGEADYKNNIPVAPEGKHNDENIEDLWQVKRKRVDYTVGWKPDI
ncbi:hypothetical protein AwEntero_02120 [Enterobacterales bacterium]|nr:hypothetical protein AwEntero_02120 [Enterobacterales bacterium]